MLQFSNFLVSGSSLWRSFGGISFGLACLCSPISSNAAIQTVTVGDPGNTPDSTGFGSVPSSFAIGKFEVTNAQYTEFLNAVDPDGSNPGYIFHTGMHNEARGGILFRPTQPKGTKYLAKSDMTTKPVTFVNWFDAARFANWMHHGQPTFGTTVESVTARETGAYTLNGAVSGTILRNPGAKWWIPAEDQWYKAAYYKSGGAAAGYWRYPTASSFAPASVGADAEGDGPGTLGNSANYNKGATWKPATEENTSAVANPTTVGTNGAASPSGAFDMGGNVWEINDAVFSNARGRRGGGYDSTADFLASSFRGTSPYGNDLSISNDGIVTYTLASMQQGFRLATGIDPRFGRTTVDVLYANAVTITTDLQDTGGATLMERGFIYAETDLNPEPLLGGAGVTKVVSAGTDQASYTQIVRSLTPGRTYSLRAFAISATGTGYGEITEATTLDSGPNAAPTGIVLSSSAVSENQPTPVVVGSFSATDENINDYHGFSLTAGDGATDNGAFSIQRSGDVWNLVLNQTPDYETKSSYSIRVFTADNGTGLLGYSQALTITVEDVNEAPVVTSHGGAAEVSLERQENQTSVTTVSATDPDVPAQSLRFSIEGGADAARFSIGESDGSLVFISAPDREQPADENLDNIYQVIVRVTDSGSPENHADQSFAITVTDLPEAPSVSLPLITGVTDTAASLSATVTTAGGGTVTGLGFVWAPASVAARPEIGVTGVTQLAAINTGSGAFAAALSGLTANTDYVVRTYAVNDLGTGYSEPVAFTTQGTEAAPMFTYASPQELPLGQAMQALLPRHTAGKMSGSVYRLVSTWAGSGNSGAADGSASTASFKRPYGITLDNAGNAYVADTNNHKIRRVATDGSVTTLAGDGYEFLWNGRLKNANGTAASFNYPMAIAIDPAGENLYVADTNNHVIRRISLTSPYPVTTFAGSSSGWLDSTTGTSAKFKEPKGLAMDAAGTFLYVADSGNHRIRKINLATAAVSTVAGSGTAGTADGTGTTATFNTPIGIALNDAGLYVTDKAGHKLRRIDVASGSVTTLAGSGTAASVDGSGAAAAFNGPHGLALDGAGNLYVAEELGNQIRRVTPLGEVSTLAGDGTASNVDGPGDGASFNAPAGIAAHRDGFLCVTHSAATAGSGNLIRRVSLSGYVLNSPLPSGLSFGRSTGGIIGTPNLLTNAADYGVTGYNYYGQHTATLNLSVVLRPVFAGPGSPFLTASGFVASGNDLAVTLGFSPAPHQVLTLVNNYGTSPVQGAFNSLDEGALLSTSFGGETYHLRISYTGGNGNDITLTRTNGPDQQDTYLVSTLAGGSSGSTDGTGATASFSQPWGIACDYAGNVYVSDNAPEPRLRKITPGGVVTTFAGGSSGFFAGHADGSALYARFYDPRGLAVDGSGNVFVADINNHRIRKVTQTSLQAASGSWVSTLAGDGTATFLDGVGTAARLNAPEGVVSDPAGNLYVADTANHRIRKITPLGEVSLFAGTGSAGGTNGAAANARFYRPSAITRDPAGNLYVAEAGGHSVRKITPEGVVTTLAGGGAGYTSGNLDGAGTNALFYGPLGIAWHPSGDLMVADTNNHRIRRVRPDGTVSTIAGSLAGFAEGAGEGAKFNAPWSIAVDASGMTYVADSSNRRIRRIVIGARPLVELAPVSDLAAGSVNLHGSVNPNGFTTTSRFDYGPTSQYGTSVPVDLLSPQGTSSETVSVSLQGLEENTVYHFRLVASNLDGSTERTGTFVVMHPEFASPYDVPVAADGFVAAGLPFGNLTIGFSPEADSVLTLVDNQSESAIVGAFSDLPEGSVVNASYGGNEFHFRLSYVGGDGNNITLTRTGGAGQVANGSDWNVATLSSGVIANPRGIAVDASGNVYVADSYAHVIYKITPTGGVSVFAGQLNASGSQNSSDGYVRFNQPAGLAIDGSGNLFVADSGNHLIRKITSGGVVTTVAGGAGSPGSTDGSATSARFNGPVAVAVDANGNLFVADQINDKIRKITTDGVVSSISGFYQPSAVVAAPGGGLYVANQSVRTVVKVSESGVISLLAGYQDPTLSGGGSSDGIGNAAKFESPIGLALDAAGNLYVADSGNYTIRRVTPGGLVSTVAGAAKVAGKLDGRGEDARFRNLFGIASDPAGRLYISDRGNNSIRMMTTGFRPFVAITAPSGISTSSATLHGTLNPNGFVTSALFEYGATTGFGSVVELTPANGTSSQNVSAIIQGLTAGATYHYRLVATNADGSTTSETGSFPAANPPVLAAVPTSGSITYQSALLSGRVENDGGIPVLECGILWSASDEVELVAGAPGVGKIVAGNLTAGDFSVSISDVNPSTRYRFRAYATTAAGTSLSVETSSFTTAPYSMATVLVGDAGNAGAAIYYSYDQTNGNWGTFGAVDHEFRMGTYEVTNFEYAAFLNAVDPEGLNPSGIYNASMGSNARGGINLMSSAMNGAKYVVKTGMRFKPVNWISWYDAARFANWNHHGNPVFATTAASATSRETGAYTLNGATSGIFERNPDAAAWIPSEDEWMKAAYYKGGSLSAGYWSYATRANANTAPASISANSSGDGTANGTGHTVNWLNGASWNGQTGNVTTVGTNGAPSVYGTYDQDGNVAEWTDSSIETFFKALRGGGWSSGGSTIQNGFPWFNPSQTGARERKKMSPGFEDESFGFRIALTATPAVATTPNVASTASASLITSSTARLAGDVTADGGATITSRGFVYSLTAANAAPELGGANVEVLSAAGTTGSFSADASGLLAESSYSFRAYATNSEGTSYSDVVTFTTATPELVVFDNTDGKTRAFDSYGGNGLSSDTAFGYNFTAGNQGFDLTSITLGLWDFDAATALRIRLFESGSDSLPSGAAIATQDYPSQSFGFTVGYHTLPLTGFRLKANTTYILFVGASSGNVNWGRWEPDINPQSNAGWTVNTMVIDSFGNYYNMQGNPNRWSIQLTGTPYAATSPVLGTTTVSNITSTAATFNAAVTDDGGLAITESGFVYAPTSVQGLPEINGTGVTQVAGAGSGSAFAANVTGLTASTSYSVRAFATSSIGTSYSEAATFTTADVVQLSPSATWRQQYFGSIENAGNASDLAKPDRDGIANLIKYALGIAPGPSGASGLPKVKIAANSGDNYLSLSFRRHPSRNDVTIIVEVQGSLGGTWTEIARSVNGGSFTGAAGVTETDNLDGSKEVEIRDIQTVGSSGRRFMRVRVER